MGTHRQVIGFKYIFLVRHDLDPRVLGLVPRFDNHLFTVPGLLI